jgi:hypothetical protein
LVEEILEAGIRGGLVMDDGAGVAIPEVPALDRFGPGRGDFGEDVEAGASILAAFRIVGGGGEEGIGPMFEAILIGAVKVIEVSAEEVGMTADLVEGDEAGPGIEGGILESFGHGWA